MSESRTSSPVVLAIETSTRRGGVVLRRADGTRSSRLFERGMPDRGAAQGRLLAPAARDLFREADMAPADVDLVAVGLGPGSYTGLRVGVALARAFAYAVKRPLVGVPSLAALARAVGREGDEFLAVARAGRDAYAWARYRWIGGARPLETLSAPRVDEGKRVRAEIRTGRRLIGEGAADLLSTKDGLRSTGDGPSAKRDDDESSDPPLPLPEHVAQWGLETFEAEGPTPHAEVLPLYLRRSAAEINWERRRGNWERRRGDANSGR